jgi:DnaJ-class molecular chaperone
VASEENDNEDQAEASHGPRECMPCRGSGKVTSNLGGAASVVTCPWCAGGGVRLQGVDAQAKWLGQDAAVAGASDDPPDAAA